MPGPLTRVCLIQLPLFALASWTLLSENDGPSPRFAHTAALGTNQALWVHAGKGDERFLDDLWVYNNLLDVWTLVGLLTAPAARKAHVAVTDPAGDLWIHGGQDGQTFFQDLWKLSANTWTLVSNSSVPARSGHIAVWDSRNRAIWIHGGFDGALRQDLWKFDTESSNWFSTDSSYQPSGRAYHVAALDEVNQELWVHGGYDGGLRQDLWNFDIRANSWELISNSGPSARARHVAIWDSTNDALWVHGGFDGMACEDLWRFETATSTWNLVEQSGPSARYDHVIAWDETRLLIFVHGGYNEDRGVLQDFWKFEVPMLTNTRTSSSTIAETSATFTFSSIAPTTGTTTSITSTTSSTSSTLVVFDSGIVAADDLFALLLALGAIGIFTCFLSVLWCRRKNREAEAVVPEPPPLRPPLPPSYSPQFRVNMQVLIPPPEPQPPRTASFPHLSLSLPELLSPVCKFATRHQSCAIDIATDAKKSPLVYCSAEDAEDVDVDIVVPAQAAQSSRHAKLATGNICRPKAPRKTESAPALPAGRQTVPAQPLVTLAIGRPQSVNSGVFGETKANFNAVPDRIDRIDIDFEIPSVHFPLANQLDHHAVSSWEARASITADSSGKPERAPELQKNSPASRGECSSIQSEPAPAQPYGWSSRLPMVGPPLQVEKGNKDKDVLPIDVCVRKVMELVDVHVVLEAIEDGPKCPAKREQRWAMFSTSMPPMPTLDDLDVEVEIASQRPPCTHDPPTSLEIPCPRFVLRKEPRRLQRSMSAQTPRRWRKPNQKVIRRSLKLQLKSMKSMKSRQANFKTSTLGGPWWKSYTKATTFPKSRGDWAVLNGNPGPGAYDLEHPRIHGRIPGREPGSPHRPRNENWRI